jgi:hypothetical protein
MRLFLRRWSENIRVEGGRLDFERDLPRKTPYFFMCCVENYLRVCVVNYPINGTFW